MKKILIDLDGVLNEYEGNFREDIIPKPKLGVKEFLENINKKFELILFTTRSSLVTSKWLSENGLENYFSKITNIKEPCSIIIDDRAINFKGSYKELEEEIEEFKPWYKAKENQIRN